MTSIFLRQQGEILVGDTWRRCSATEQLSANPPRFVWDARISLLPLLNVRVVDAYDQREATLTDRDTTVSLEFTFNARNEVTRIYTPSRARAVGRRFESTSWTQFGRDEEHCGMWIPMEGEVSWQLGWV